MLYRNFFSNFSQLQMEPGLMLTLSINFHTFFNDLKCMFLVFFSFFPFIQKCAKLVNELCLDPKSVSV